MKIIQEGGLVGAGTGAEAWTFDLVEARLVEAVGFRRRMPDRERGWLRGSGVMGLWRQVNPRAGMNAVEWADWQRIDPADRDVAPRLPGLTAAEVGRMEEAERWVDDVPTVDRPVLAAGLGQLAAGRSRISWDDVLLRLGVVMGKEGLRKRYTRAIGGIAGRLNGGFPR